MTWFLDDPVHVYREFYRVLRPGGKILVYDANWHIPFYYPDMLEKVRENEKDTMKDLEKSLRFMMMTKEYLKIFLCQILGDRNGT